MHRRKRKGAGSNLFTEKTFRRNSEVIKGEANSNTHTQRGRQPVISLRSCAVVYVLGVRTCERVC